MKNEKNVIEYMQGLAPIAANLEKLIAGSNLSHQELAFLAYAQGYLNAADSHLINVKLPEIDTLHLSETTYPSIIAGLKFPPIPF